LVKKKSHPQNQMHMHVVNLTLVN